MVARQETQFHIFLGRFGRALRTRSLQIMSAPDTCTNGTIWRSYSSGSKRSRPSLPRKLATSEFIIHTIQPQDNSKHFQTCRWVAARYWRRDIVRPSCFGACCKLLVLWTVERRAAGTFGHDAAISLTSLDPIRLVLVPLRRKTELQATRPLFASVIRRVMPLMAGRGCIGRSVRLHTIRINMRSHA